MRKPESKPALKRQRRENRINKDKSATEKSRIEARRERRQERRGSEKEESLKEQYVAYFRGLAENTLKEEAGKKVSTKKRPSLRKNAKKEGVIVTGKAHTRKSSSVVEPTPKEKQEPKKIEEEISKTDTSILDNIR